jgi:hypothetical protein
MMPIRLLVPALMAALVACGGDDVENTGRSCEVADDCYPGLDHASLHGDVRCLDRVQGGYCTHLCVDDDDCCAVEGECATSHPQVCSPFENDTTTTCFLSCEPDVIGDREENAYCREFAHESFLCRSSGGGTANRKVCVPG